MLVYPPQLIAEVSLPTYIMRRYAYDSGRLWAVLSFEERWGLMLDALVAVCEGVVLAVVYQDR